LLVVPFCLLLLLNVVLGGPGVVEKSQPALRGAAPVVAGLTLSTGLKMTRSHRWTPLGLVFGGLTLVGVGLVQLPLLLVLAVLAPLSLAFAWRTAT
jgi:chromate transporter